MEVTDSNRSIINNIMYSLSIAFTSFHGEVKHNRPVFTLFSVLPCRNNPTYLFYYILYILLINLSGFMYIKYVTRHIRADNIRPQCLYRTALFL